MVQNNSQTRARILLSPTLFKNFLERIMSAANEECDGRVKLPPPPPPVILLLAVPRRLFCFGSLVVLDVVFRYLSLFLLYININIGKNRC